MTGNSNKRVVLCVSMLLVAGCQTAPDTVNMEMPSSVLPRGLAIEVPALNTTKASLLAYFDEWQGTPYRWGGSSKKGIDCSAFTQTAYQAVFQHQLPRTTLQQAKNGDRIALSQASYGDLIFFKTGRSLYHVGIFIGDLRFMHASSSKGVIISRLDNPYWASTLWQIRRYSE